MIVLVSGATTYPRSESVGYLAVPRNWNKPETLATQGHLVQWAGDNGCFLGFDPGALMRMLFAFKAYRETCRFVAVPDVVSDAASTLELWEFWAPIVRAAGYRPAFVIQNGITHARVPWGEFSTLFVGGDDAFKEGPLAASLCGYAKAQGLDVHWGRVNGKRRYRLALEAGADSIDGTGFSMHADTNIPKVADWHQQITDTPSLFSEVG